MGSLALALAQLLLLIRFGQSFLLRSMQIARHALATLDYHELAVILVFHTVCKNILLQAAQDTPNM